MEKMKYDIHGIPIKIKFHASQRIAERVGEECSSIEEQIYFIRRLIKEGKVVRKVTKDGEVGMIRKGKYRAKFTIRGGVLWVLTIEED
ncbi:MAG: hypothetical protein HY930_06480 [Euryarchaeota archaeon]|nr:hypothetical protein [Euryarchaeota archaeon]